MSLSKTDIEIYEAEIENYEKKMTNLILETEELKELLLIMDRQIKLLNKREEGLIESFSEERQKLKDEIVELKLTINRLSGGRWKFQSDE